MKNDRPLNGNRKLFTQLLRPEYKRANIFCRKLLGNSEAGDDLFQEALVTAYERLGDLKDINAFRPWLYRIIINRFHSETRRPWYKKVLPLTPQAESALPGDDPADRYAARDLLRIAFGVLGPIDQALVKLHELEGWSVEELATLYSRSEGAIKTALFRARRRMKKRLMQIEPKIDMKTKLKVPTER